MSRVLPRPAVVIATEVVPPDARLAGDGSRRDTRVLRGWATLPITLGEARAAIGEDTALVSVIGLPDILRQTGVAARVTKEAFAFYSLACLLFLVLAFISSLVFSRIEKWAKRSEVAR